MITTIIGQNNADRYIEDELFRTCTAVCNSDFINASDAEDVMTWVKDVLQKDPCVNPHAVDAIAEEVLAGICLSAARVITLMKFIRGFVGKGDCIGLIWPENFLQSRWIHLVMSVAIMSRVDIVVATHSDHVLNAISKHIYRDVDVDGTVVLHTNEGGVHNRETSPWLKDGKMKGRIRIRTYNMAGFHDCGDFYN